jgi:hypothetical protein
MRELRRVVHNTVETRELRFDRERQILEVAVACRRQIQR